MKTLGIITEYNPFHQGHAYMLERAKRKADADRVVVIMSGSFVQRGEPAIFDKWTITAAALKNGADLVLELPVLFAAANAESLPRPQGYTPHGGLAAKAPLAWLHRLPVRY